MDQVVIVGYDDVIWCEYLVGDAGVWSVWVHGAVGAACLCVELKHQLLLVTHEQL